MREIKANTGKKNGVYHTDPECHVYQQINSTKEATDNEIEYFDMKECQTCKNG